MANRQTLRAYLAPLRITDTTVTGIGKASALGAAGTVAQSAMRTLTNILIGRIAGPAALGVISSALSLGNFMNLVWPSTAGSAAAKFIGRARGQNDLAVVAAATAHLGRRTIVVSMVLGVLAIPIWASLDDGRMIDGAAVTLLIIGLSLSAFTRGIHFGVGQIPRAAFWDVLSGIVGFAGAAVALLLGADGLVVLFPISASYLLYSVACWPRGAKGTLPRSLRREVDAFVLVGSLGTVASAGFLHLSLLVVRVGWSAGAAGQYAAALALATPAALIANSLSMALYPRMAQDYGRGAPDAVALVTDRFTRFLTFLLVSILGTLALMRETLVMLIWGDSFILAADLLPILLLAVLFASIRVPAVNYLSSGPARGIILTTVFSVAGLVVGLLMWLLIQVTDGPILLVAFGYAAGALTTSASIIGVVWSRARLAWGGLWIRLAFGLLAIAGIMFLQVTFILPLWMDILLGATFLSMWVTAFRKEFLSWTSP